MSMGTVRVQFVQGLGVLKSSEAMPCIRGFKKYKCFDKGEDVSTTRSTGL